MKRLIAAGMWIIAVTMAAAYVSSTWGSRSTENGVLIKGGDLERKKTMPLNVPMIANGIVEGYIVAQFIYLADARKLKELAIAPDDFITDEAFRLLYSSKVDFKQGFDNGPHSKDQSSLCKRDNKRGSSRGIHLCSEAGYLKISFVTT
jgi:hypothetical protein